MITARLFHNRLFMNHSAFLIAFFATVVRYYDYALFGFSAAVLSKTFMPDSSADKQLLNFFAVFSLSVLARPIGSVIFGIIADNYGRVRSVKISVVLAVFSTSIIAFAPSFESIGWWAVSILTFSRMIFLMSLAGEVDTIRIYVAEKVNKAHKNTLNGVVSFFSQVGALLAASSYHFANLNQDYYSWRINFIIGGIGGVLVILLRHYFQETEEFLEFKRHVEHPSVILKQVQHNRGVSAQGDLVPKFIIATLINGCIGGIYHFSIIFFSVFMSKVGGIISGEQAEVINIKLIITYAISSLIAGILADRLNVQKLVYTVIIASIVGLSLVISIGVEEIFIYYIFFIVALLPFYSVPLQIKIQALFNVSIRTRMCSLSHSLGGMILSSTAPLIGMMLWEYYNSTGVVLAFLIVLLFILFGSVLKIFKV